MTTNIDAKESFAKYVEDSNHRGAARVVFRLNDEAFAKLFAIEELLRYDFDSLTSYEMHAMLHGFKHWRKMLSAWYSLLEKSYARVSKEQGKKKADKLFGSLMELD